MGLVAIPLTAQAGVLSQRVGDTYLAWEAEEFHTNVPGDPVGVWNVITDPAASHGQALQASGTSGTKPGALATYVLQFASTGTYQLYFRKIAPDGTSDSMWRSPSFNAAPADPPSVGITGSATYQWYNDSVAPTDRYVASDTSTTLQLMIGSREANFRVDRFVLSTNKSLTDSQLDALFNWNGIAHATQNGDWSTASSWDYGSPTAEKPAYVGGGRTITLASPGQKAFSLTIGYDGTNEAGNGTLIQQGGDLTVLHDVTIASNTVGTGDVTGAYQASGGTLTVGSETARANLYVARHTTTTNVNATATLDLAGATQFDAYLNALEIGNRTQSSSASGAAAGTVILAQTSNIDTKTFLLSENRMWIEPPQSKLLLGATTNLKVDTMTVAGYRGKALVDFAAGVTGGVLNLSGSTTTAADLRIGYCTSGTGTATTGIMDLSGGTFNATLDDLIIGYKEHRGEYHVTGNGTLTFDAGTVTANRVAVGWGTPHPSDGTVGQGIGVLNMGGGSLTVAGDLELGKGTVGSQGTLTMTGGQTLVHGSVLDGPGTSTLNIDGGTLTVDGNLAADNLRVGSEVHTAMITAGGAVTSSPGANWVIGQRTVGSTAATTGTLDLGGASQVTLNLANLQVGFCSGGDGGQVSGTLNLSNTGANTINATTLTVGESTSGGAPVVQGALHLKTTNTIRADSVYVGRRKGQGQVDIVAGGTLDLAGLSTAQADLYIGYNDNTTTMDLNQGTVDLSGGTFNASLDQLVIGYHQYPWNHAANGSGTGTLTFDAGTVTANTVTIGSGSIDPPNATYPAAAAEGRGVGTLNLMGGSLTASSITLGTGSSRAQGIVNLSGGTLTVDTVSKGIGSGTFHWTAGTLHVNDFGFSLQQDGGVLAPGNSIGTTAIDGDYRQAAAGSLEIEIANQGLGGVDYDLVTVNGDVDLDGQLLVRFLDGFLPAAGSVFDVLTATGTIDATGLVLAGDEPDAEPWVLTVAPGLAGSSILRLSTAVAVPEPSSVFLAALGLLALAPWRRRGTAKLS
jgi:hypothetical protein